jgi:hypothetical protein
MNSGFDPERSPMQISSIGQALTISAIPDDGCFAFRRSDTFVALKLNNRMHVAVLCPHLPNSKQVQAGLLQFPEGEPVWFLKRSAQSM